MSTKLMSTKLIIAVAIMMTASNTLEKVSSVFLAIAPSSWFPPALGLVPINQITVIFVERHNGARPRLSQTHPPIHKDGPISRDMQRTLDSLKRQERCSLAKRFRFFYDLTPQSIRTSGISTSMKHEAL